MRKLIHQSLSGLSAIIRRQLRLRMSGSAPHPLSIENDDAGSNAVYLDFFRDSASPAASDLLGYIAQYGRDSGGNKEAYGVFGHIILDPANGSEDSKWVIESKVAGILTRSANFGAGLWIEGATGGDPGVGKINATEVQVNGTALPFTKSYTSAQIAIVAAADGALTHGLGERPKLVACELVCISAEAGYASGDVIFIGTPLQGGAASPTFSIAIVGSSTTQIYYTMMNSANIIILPHKTTGASTTCTNANWELVVKAWA